MLSQPSEEGELLRNRLPVTARGYLKHPSSKNGKALIENLRNHKAGCFNALSAVGRRRALAKPASGYSVRLSKTSKLEEWKGAKRKFAKPQSRMFQCSLSRRKEASSGEAGFRLRREVIITRNIPQEKKGIPLNFLASCGTINPEPITLLSNSHIL